MPQAATKHAALEHLPAAETHDLLYAAAAMHWTEPKDRWSRVAALVEPDGVFASFGGQLQLDEVAVEEAVRSVRSAFLADDGVRSPDGTPEAAHCSGREPSSPDPTTSLTSVRS